MREGGRDCFIKREMLAVGSCVGVVLRGLRGTFGWPEHWAPRGVLNKSWVEHGEGAEFEELKRRHDESLKLGDGAWGPEGRTATYASASVGLVRGVMGGGAIVQSVREEAVGILRAVSNFE